MYFHDPSVSQSHFKSLVAMLAEFLILRLCVSRGLSATVDSENIW